MEISKSYTANIYVGTRPGYNDIHENFLIANKQKITSICQKYCDDVGLGLTVTDTQFIYTNGNEPGTIVGLINYPRFPALRSKIKITAIDLAKILLKELEQERLTIVLSDETIMIEKEDL